MMNDLVHVVPYGVLGLQFTEEHGIVQKGEDPVALESCVIVDAGN